MKACRMCGETKPLDEFHRQSSARDGRQGRCKTCAKRVSREHYHANPERSKAFSKAWQENHKEERAAYMRDYYKANPEKFDFTATPEARAAKRDYNWRRMQTPEARAAKRAHDRAAYLANPQPYKERAMQRRVRLLGAPIAHFTEKDWRRQVRRQDGCCFYCGESVELTKDHLIPLIRGGAHSVGNIVGACITCNCKKNAKTRTEFLMWLRRKAVAA